ncbi:MAG: serine hydrolase [Alphaproteobacteria bacterium]|nr:serine hydrolase [Hyphomonas sp.]MBR9808054.1 serine hydrolase [Alphaproteobacteria bacterium]|tara:strand:+ start:4157 stop:5365 length:1209 start_codon:yes stop_codon:yes gene_type:complete
MGKFFVCSRYVKSGLAALGLMLAPGLASAEPLVPLPPQPDELAWPTSGWETGEMPAETATLIQPVIDRAMAGELADPMGETRAIVIIHHGKLVFETYRNGFGPDTKQVSWSMAKSITSSLVGRAVNLGLIDDLDAPMPTPFAAGDPRAEITWRQWLTMTDGLDYLEIGATDLMTNDVVQMMYGAGRFDVLQYAQDNLPRVHTPGVVWNYSTAGFHLISHALQQVSGAADFTDWFDRNLADPIGMDAVIEYDTAGTYLGGSLVWASARDFAKFGYLYLRDGMWDGRRLLPDGWVDFSRTDPQETEANTYGAGFWLTPSANPVPASQAAHSPPYDAFSAQGHEGQTIWIVPSRDLVIVHLGLMDNAGDNWPHLYEWNQEIARAFPPIAADANASGETEAAEQPQ